MKLSTIIVFILLSYTISGQISLKSSTTIGGSSFDSASGIIETPDNKFIIAGSSSSDDLDMSTNIGSNDIILIQMNTENEIEWIKNYGGSEDDKADDIIQTEEGGYLLVGGSRSSDFQVSSNQGLSDVWIVKLNEMGDIQWQLSVGDTLWDDSRDVIQNSEGDYVILSRTQKEQTFDDCLLTKVDQQGNLVWNKTFGGSEEEWPAKILETNDGYFLVGSSESSDMDVSSNNGETDFWILKTDFDGNKLWDRNYGELGYEIATSAIMTQDGHIIIIGRAYNADQADNNGDYWITKIDQNGEMIWDKRYGGSEIDNPTQIEETADRNLNIIGFSSSSDRDLESNNGNNDFWFLQLDENGDKLNSFSFGGSDIDRLTQMSTTNGKIFVAGHSYSDDYDIASNNGFSDIWFGELDITSSINETISGDNITCWPNPTNDILHLEIPSNEQLISFTLCNLNGAYLIATNKNTLDLTSYNAGCYYAIVKTNLGSYKLKVIRN